MRPLSPHLRGEGWGEGSLQYAAAVFVAPPSPASRRRRREARQRFLAFAARSGIEPPTTGMNRGSQTNISLPIRIYILTSFRIYFSDLPSWLVRGVFRRRAVGRSEDRRSAVRLVTGSRKAISAFYARLRRATDPARLRRAMAVSALRSPSFGEQMRANPPAQLRRGTAQACPLFEIVNGFRGLAIGPLHATRSVPNLL